jgi:hypothetical protein
LPQIGAILILCPTWGTLQYKKRLKIYVFGIAYPAMLYPHFDHWEHNNANLHISFLFSYFRQLHKAGKLGKNLMLQMDNCWRDNKNKWFFGFLAYLAAFGWFDSVEIYLLVP